MNGKADRLKAALRENLKRRKAHMRDRDGGRNTEGRGKTREETQEKAKDESREES